MEITSVSGRSISLNFTHKHVCWRVFQTCHSDSLLSASNFCTRFDDLDQISRSHWYWTVLNEHFVFLWKFSQHLKSEWLLVKTNKQFNFFLMDLVILVYEGRYWRLCKNVNIGITILVPVLMIPLKLLGNNLIYQIGFTHLHGFGWPWPWPIFKLTESFIIILRVILSFWIL